MIRLLLWFLSMLWEGNLEWGWWCYLLLGIFEKFVRNRLGNLGFVVCDRSYIWEVSKVKVD